MTQTLSEELKAAGARLPLPPGDLQSVVGEARHRTSRRRRGVATFMAVAAVVTTLGSLNLAVNDNGQQPSVVSSEPTPALAQPTSPKFASTPAWQELGDQLVAAKRAAAADPSINGGMYAGSADFRFGAYQSEPIDVTGHGEYILRVGPLGDDFPNPLPVGFGFGIRPPPDAAFETARTVLQGVNVVDGRRYLELKMIILPTDRFDSPYPGFRVWVS